MYSEKFLERWPRVWSLEWCYHYLLVGPIFTVSIDVHLEKRRGDVGVMYVLGICQINSGRMKCGGGGVRLF